MWFDDHENDDQTADQPQPSNLVSVQPAADSIEAQFAAVIHRDVIDAKMGFSRYVQGTPKKGWLVNIQPTILDDGVSPLGRSGVELYFLEDDGDYFKATVLYEPYFYVVCKSGTETDVEEYIKRKYRPQLLAINVLKKDDLTLVRLLFNQAKSSAWQPAFRLKTLFSQRVTPFGCEARIGFNRRKKFAKVQK